MLKLLTQLLNIIFPPRPTEEIIQKTSIKVATNLYSPGTFQTHIYLCSYQNPIIKASVIENKFHGQAKATQILCSLLEMWKKHQIMPTLYIPIPLGPKRLRERGYNQVENILNTIDSNIEINKKILIRNIETAQQSELDKSNRHKNMQDAFSYVGKSLDLSKYKQVVIVDDVVTTGATLDAARATLAPHLPPHITLRTLAIAH